ncbi:dynamin family protein [Paenibacillus thailandensis]|uniref:Dynamin family protein n=1 Tax=Paenibacillus thailandensis TaxID=393250 RepID=A0ABW5R166_9BACL
MKSAELASRLLPKLRSQQAKLAKAKCKEQLLQKATELEQWVRGARIRVKDCPAVLLDDFCRYAEEQANGIRLQAEGLDKPFLLFIVGMGKYGKSTLINALIGQAAADTDALPKTWKVDVYEGGDEQAPVTVIYKDGRTERLGREQARAFLFEEERKQEESELKAYEEFTQAAGQLETIEEKEELRALLIRRFIYHSPLAEVHWPINGSPFLKKFRVVDTPGLFQKLVGELKMSAVDYYHKADGILWLLDATQISAQGSKSMLEEIERLRTEIGVSPDNTIAVLNQMDKVRSVGGEEAVQAVEEEARRLFGAYFSRFVSLSAKQSWEGVRDQDEQKLHQGQLSRLLRMIDELFWRNQTDIQLQSKLQGYNYTMHELEHRRNEYVRQFALDAKRYAEVRAELSEGTAKLSGILQGHADEYIVKYRKELQQNIDLYGQTAYDMDKSQSYIDQHIFGSPSLKPLSDEYERKSNESIAQYRLYFTEKSLFTEISKLKIANLPETLKNLLLQSDAFLNLDRFFKMNGLSMGALAAWAMVDMISVMGPGIFILGPLVLIGGLIALLWEGLAAAWNGFIGLFESYETKVNKFKADLRRQADEMAKKLKETLMKQNKEAVTKASDEIEKLRDLSFAALHCPVGEMRGLLNHLQSLRTDKLSSFPVPAAKEIILSAAPDRISSAERENAV